jgi:hypothetical protein
MYAAVEADIPPHEVRGREEEEGKKKEKGRVKG